MTSRRQQRLKESRRPLLIDDAEKRRPERRGDAGGEPLVAIRITGGIGDHLVAARFIRDLLAYAGEFRFDVYSSRPKSAEWVFSRMPEMNRCYNEYLQWHGNLDRYPLALWVSHYVVIHNETARWDELYKHNKRLLGVCEVVARTRCQFDHHVARHPLSDNSWAREAVMKGYARRDILHRLSAIQYGGDRFPVTADDAALALHPRLRGAFVTIHNGYDEGFLEARPDGGNLPTKVYPHFEKLVALIHENFPDVTVVQVGGSTSKAIAGVDLSLVGKTSLAQLAGVLSRSALHIDSESGLVHLATCLGVKACVMFGPTPMEFLPTLRT